MFAICLILFLAPPELTDADIDAFLTPEVLEIGRLSEYIARSNQQPSVRARNQWIKKNPYNKFKEWGWPILDAEKAKHGSMGFVVTENAFRITELVDDGTVKAFWSARNLSVIITGIDTKELVENQKVTLKLPVILSKKPGQHNYTFYIMSESRLKEVAEKATRKL